LKYIFSSIDKEAPYLLSIVGGLYRSNIVGNNMIFSNITSNLSITTTKTKIIDETNPSETLKIRRIYWWIFDENKIRR